MGQGWRVRIRIDPMIAGFDYAWLIERVRRLGPERVTLGTLRAEANLWRFVDNGVLAELEKPDDPKGVARYPLEQRLAIYRPAVESLADVCPLGLCEETQDVWEALGLDFEAKSCNCGT
jgi:DNA repair photolyase